MSTHPEPKDDSLDARAIAHFQRTVAPRLKEVEAERLRQRSVFVRRLGLFLGAAVPAMGLALWYTDGNRAVLFACMVVVVAAVLWIHTPMHRYRKHARPTVIGAICDSLGNLSFRPAINPQLDTFPEIERYVAAGLARTHGFSRRLDRFQHRVDDLLTGTHLGVAFEVRRVWIGHAGKNGRTDFHGLLGAITLPYRFEGETRIAPIDGGAEGLHPIKTGHADFDDQFPVLASLPKEVPRLLQPRFLDGFMALQADHRPWGRSLRATFTDGQLLFALDQAGALFEPAGLALGSEAADARRRQLVTEIVIPHRLVGMVLVDDHAAS